MRGDLFATLGTAQAITASAVTTDSYDLLAAKDIGIGGPWKPRLHIWSPAAFVPIHGANVAVSFTDTGDLVGLTAHALPLGTPVVFNTIATTTGLTAGTIYYVAPGTSANNFTLAATRAAAITTTPGTPVALTTNGTGTMTVLATLEPQIVVADDSALTVNVTPVGSLGQITYRAARACTLANSTDLVTLAAHGLKTGDPVQFALIASGALPTELTAGTTYYVVYASTSTFYVATSLEKARAGSYIVLSGDSTATVTVQKVDNILTANGVPLVVEANAYLGRDIGQRYIGGRFLCENGAFSAGTATTKLGADGQDFSAPRPHPTGWSYRP